VVATSLGASFLLSSARALAQDNATRSRGEPAANPESRAGAPTGDTTNARSSAAEVERDQAAARAYQQALSAYSRGDVQAAFQNMQQSYLLSGRAELLFNLARLERELQHCEAARSDYEGYVRSVQNGKFRSEAQQAVQDLQRQCPADSAPKTEPASSAAEPPADPPAALPPPSAVPFPRTRESSHARAESYWTARRIVGWSATASGVITGGVALYFLNAAISDHDAAAKIAAPYKSAPRNPPWASKEEAEHRELRAAYVLGITAGALVVGGVVVLLLSPKSNASATASATIAAYPGYLGAVCSGRF